LNKINRNDRKKDIISSSAKGDIFWTQRNIHIVILLVICFVLTVIIVPKGGFLPDYRTGDIVSRDIRSPRDILVPDEPLTLKKREQAAAAVLPLYDFDGKVIADVAERFTRYLLHTAKILEQGTSGAVEPAPSDDLKLTAEQQQQLNQFLLVSMYPNVGDDAFQSTRIDQLKSLFQVLQGRKIVSNLQLFQSDSEKGIVLRDLNSRQELTLTSVEQVIGLDGTLKLLAGRLEKLETIAPRYRAFFIGQLPHFLRPNLTFNKDETELRKQTAAAEVAPVLFQIKKGEMIARVGSRISKEEVVKLRTLKQIGSDTKMLLSGTGLFLCLLLLFYFTHRFCKKNIRKYDPVVRDLLFLAGTLLSIFILIKIGIFISSALAGAFPYIDSSSYHYAFPFAFGAMLVRLVLNSETAYSFALVSGIVFGILFGNSLYISIYVIVGSLVAAHAVRHCKERSTLYIAGLQISAANFFLIIGIQMVARGDFDLQLLYQLGFGLLGGFVCAVMINGTIPLVELIFKYTTDIKLLELANMNTPVFRELMIQAPGTYHHSIIVGNLVESAAEAINANPLLARVSAYYHDIGKSRKPLYFSENMRAGENKHDKLAPSMSALILMSHLKDGVEMAREYKLGEELIDIIRQHHGTSLMKFFYDKAKKQTEDGEVNESDYRYPGPKPQTREAALIMLADAVEAASRTLPDPTPARIQGMVQKIINNIFIDGQLDECELTLKDMHNIAKSFTRVLTGIFHNRVEYPEPAYKEGSKKKDQEKDSAEKDKKKNGEYSDRESARETAGQHIESPDRSQEDLRRLGMS